MAVYHLGNNLEFHGDIYDLAIRTPGLLVIHDLALDDFVMGMVATAQPFGHQAMREGLLLAPRLHGFEEAERNDPLRVPYVAHAARNARGIIALAVRRTLPARVRLQDLIYVAPHPVVESEPHVRKAEGAACVIRGSLESMGMRTLVGVYGDQNAAKLIDVVVEAMVHLPQDVHLALVGRRIPGYDVEPLVRGSGSAPVSRSTPTCPTRTSSRGCAPRTSRSTSVPASWRGIRLARPLDAMRSSDGGERDGDVSRSARGRRRARAGGPARTP